VLPRPAHGWRRHLERRSPGPCRPGQRRGARTQREPHPASCRLCSARGVLLCPMPRPARSAACASEGQLRRCRSRGRGPSLPPQRARPSGPRPRRAPSWRARCCAAWPSPRPARPTRRSTSSRRWTRCRWPPARRRCARRWRPGSRARCWPRSRTRRASPAGRTASSTRTRSSASGAPGRPPMDAQRGCAVLAAVGCTRGQAGAPDSLVHHLRCAWSSVPACLSRQAERPGRALSGERKL